jgi:hypothetical protein
MATPLKFTPRKVSQGTVSRPVPQPGPRFQGALLPTPSVKKAKVPARKS